METGHRLLLKARQQVPNGVTYAEPQVTKPRLDLITVSAIPELQSSTSQSGIGWPAAGLPKRPWPFPKGKSACND